MPQVQRQVIQHGGEQLRLRVKPWGFAPQLHFYSVIFDMELTATGDVRQTEIMARRCSAQCLDQDKDKLREVFAIAPNIIQGFR